MRMPRPTRAVEPWKKKKCKRKRVRVCGMDLFSTRQGPLVGCCEDGNERSGLIKYRGISLLAESLLCLKRGCTVLLITSKLFIQRLRPLLHFCGYVQ